MPHAPGLTARALAGALALASAAAAAVLALHHPLAPWLCLLGCMLTAAAAAARPAWWPAVVLPLMPMVGLMPWSGWLLVEELDLLLLATAAGAYARLAIHQPPDEPAGQRPMPWAWLSLIPMLMVTGWALSRGMSGATPALWHWWQGYREPLNSLRLAKPAIAALLALPLMLWTFRRQPEASARAFGVGMVGLLAAVSWGVFWERWAYPGLLNFSSDYRAVGLFWEMHVGGAALDAALVMALPFGVAALVLARAARGWMVCALVLALAAYAALTTFSRIVYLAAPAAVALWWWLDRRRLGVSASSVAVAVGAGGFLLALAFAAWLFPSGGYRSMTAWLGALVLLLPMVQLARPLPARFWGMGLLGGMVGAGLAALSLWVHKGAYGAYALAWLVTAASALAAHRGSKHAGVAMLAGYFSVLASLVCVGLNWGGAATLAAGLSASGALLLVLVIACARARPLWPESWKWQGTWLASVALGAAAIGVFVGGAYMSDRFASTRDDRQVRLGHTYKVLSWLSTEEWWLGKGLGRFVDSYALSGQAEDQVGDYRLAGPSARTGGAESGALIITSGKHTLGWGEIFRVSQRVDPPAPGPLQVRLLVRRDASAAKPQAAQGLQRTGGRELLVELHVDLCEKHLLYANNCLTHGVGVPEGDGAWQSVTFALPPHALTRGSWWAPRFIVFSIAVGTPGQRLEVTQISLRDSAGHELLTNGEFQRGMSRWFFSSDRHHMPWHAKNMVVHLLFEQGILGLGAWVLALSVGLWRLVGGAARSHPLAPPLAAALAGAMLVGLVDSIWDMPRIAWLLLTALTVSLVLPHGYRGKTDAGP